MSEKKEIRVALIGTGLMGRTHSNGYNRIANFFPELEYTPVLQVACSRNAEKAKGFCRAMGLQII
jgi:predicted dehydrogenase